MNTLLTVPPTSRVGRYPKHRFLRQDLPFTANLIALAPVLPGETLENLYFESRIVTDPVANSIIGWKKQFFWFYVKITDLELASIRDMFVDETNTDLTATLGAAAQERPWYTPKGGIDYGKRCMKRIVETYFRDEGQAWDAYKLADGTPIVQIREQSWMDSLTDKDLMLDGAATASATDMGDMDRALDAYNMLRALGMANMTYEDWLRSQGISIPTKDENKPELLAQFQEFQYPSNTVNPSDGTPSSALSWVFKNGERKPKFFKEPGFIVGVSVTRPKVYYSGQAGSVASYMSRAWDWVPNYMQSMPETSLKYFAGDSGPLGDRLTAPDGYWIDMRDLLLYGDQLHNMVAWNTGADPAVLGSAHMIPLPDGANFNYKYPTEAQIKEFFKTPASAYYVKQDGYVSLSIKGRQIDFTQGNFAQI